MQRDQRGRLPVVLALLAAISTSAIAAMSKSDNLDRKHIEELSRLGDVQVAAGRVILTLPAEKLFFSTSDDLTPTGKRTISRLGYLLSGHQNQRVIIENYTDRVGLDPINEELTENRSRRIDQILVSQGVIPEQTTHIGKGESASNVSSVQITIFSEPVFTG